MDDERSQQAINEALGPPQQADDSVSSTDSASSTPDAQSTPDTQKSTVQGNSPTPRTMAQGVGRSLPTAPRPTYIEGQRGRMVRDLPAKQHPGGSVSVTATVRRMVADGNSSDSSTVPFSVGQEDLRVGREDLRVGVRSRPKGSLVILTVDTSGSMGAEERAEAATGSVLGLLTDAYQRRDQVCMITFRADSAETILPPTGSTEVARRRLASLQTGGSTPLAAGLDQALEVATSAAVRRNNGRDPLVVLLSDCRATTATTGDDPFEAAQQAARRISNAGIRSLVIDCETGSPRLGLARELATEMGARYIVASELNAVALDSTIRNYSQGSLQ